MTWQEGWAGAVEVVLEAVRVGVRPILLLWLVRELIMLFKVTVE